MRGEIQRRLNQSAHAVGPRLGAHQHPQLTIEGDKADAVAIFLRRARQCYRGIERVIELGNRIHAGRHQTARVQCYENRVTPLGLMLTNHQPPAARSRVPVQVARVVAVDVVAQ